jgi:hypothetical protein
MYCKATADAACFVTARFARECEAASFLLRAELPDFDFDFVFTFAIK